MASTRLKRLAEACDVNQNELMAFFGHGAPPITCIDEPNALRLVADIAHSDLFINSAHRAQFRGLDGDGIGAAIDDMLAPFNERNVPASWFVEHSTLPRRLGPHLERAGLVQRGAAPGMGVYLSELNEALPHASDMTLTRVDTPAHLDDWLRVTTVVDTFPAAVVALYRESFDALVYPADGPLHLFVGYLHGEAVGCSLIFEHAGSAGLYDVRTLPAARGRGVGTAMTLGPLRFARERGAEVAVLHGMPAAHRLYVRMGFVDVFDGGFWVFTPPTA